MTQALTHETAAAVRFGLSDGDYREIVVRLGRKPNPIEARMFGVMWSEHCGYKHSRRTLRRLPSTSPRVLSGPGGNAGVVSIGHGWAIAFKMESHNHPSAVDPYNGAATGVGGIIRDVLAMGARPIALLDSLRFGPLDDPRSRRLAGGVVAGIAGYGNAIGVPTVGGEVLTDPCYRDNPLVNVACLGLVRADRVAGAAARGPGNAVLYVGARTGRDGIGGAAFASAELDESREREDRASVQIGDPFTGKSLIEATLEALEGGAVVAIQDMGAGGITCAASEMAARGGVGMAIDLDRVPLREAAMRPEEVLLSESQERMLLVISAQDAARVAAAYQRWGLAAEVIGRVTADPALVVTWQGRTVVDLAPDALADAPAYDPEARAPADRTWRTRKRPAPRVPPRRSRSARLADPAAALLRLLRHPDVASKRRIFEQYDHMVGVRTAVAPGSDAAVLRVLGAPPLGLAVVADGNARWCADDPRAGAALIVLEAAANLACAGAEPIAVTDCLNFGNPERPDVFWTFREAVDGIAEACTVLDVPVIGGNVSFYNEAAPARASDDGARAAPSGILPTPVIGMVGLVEDVSRRVGPGFVREGDLVVLLGEGDVSLDASLYRAAIEGEPAGQAADAGLNRAARAIRCVRRAVGDGLLASAHDVSDGGVAVALAEACILGQTGASVTIPDASFGRRARADAAESWFGEGPGRFVVSVAPERLAALEALARTHRVACRFMGTVGGASLGASSLLRGARTPVDAVDIPLPLLTDAWNSLEV